MSQTRTKTKTKAYGGWFEFPPDSTPGGFMDMKFGDPSTQEVVHVHPFRDLKHAEDFIKNFQDSVRERLRDGANRTQTLGASMMSLLGTSDIIEAERKLLLWKAAYDRECGFATFAEDMTDKQRCELFREFFET